MLSGWLSWLCSQGSPVGLGAEGRAWGTALGQSMCLQQQQLWTGLGAK